MDSAGNDKHPTRRKFMARASAAIAGLIGLGLSIPLVGYIISPALGRRAEKPFRAGLLSGVPAGQPVEMEAVIETTDGWMKTMATRAIWVVKKTSGEIRVYNPHCTHLGCAYRWDQDDNAFKCPCHRGVYDLDGNVIGGPPPRPLDRLEFHTENGALFVNYQDYKAGTGKRIPI